jgi:hypothetical protein
MEVVFGPISLGGIGVVFYAALLGVTARRRVTPRMRAVVFIAGGIHLALLGVLLTRRILCAPCLLTGAGALLATLWLATGVSVQFRSIVICVVAGVFAGATGSIVAVRAADRVRIGEAVRAATALLAGRPRPADGRVDLIVFTREDCPHCRAFKADALPATLAMFGEILNVEELR